MKALFDKVTAFFEAAIAPAVQHDDAHASHLATALLMLEVGRADFSIAEAELVQVAAALQARFGLAQEEVATLVELAIEAHDQAHSMHPFLQLLNQRFTAEQKLQIVEDLWRVAYADEVLDKYEEYHIRKIADLLYVPHGDFIRAKHRVLGAGA